MRLERLQNRAARLVTGALFRTPTDKLLRDLGWTILRTRREVNCVIHMYKINNARFCTPHYLTDTLPDTRDQVTSHNLRNAGNFSLPSNRLSSYRNSFIPRTVRSWNKLPATVRAKPTLATFKRAVVHEYGAQRPSAFFAFDLKRPNVLHTRLRLDTSKLNAHLFYSSQTESPHCACRHTLETSKHFLLHCPLYNASRHIMETSINSIVPTFSIQNSHNKLDIILFGRGLSEVDGRAVARAVKKFITGTGRFD